MTIHDNIHGFILTSLVDWDGKVSSVIFLPGCNFKCSFCANKPLINGTGEKIEFKKIMNAIEKNKEFVDGIVITGGEPSIYNDLEEFLGELKNKGFRIKLDTNGSNPEMLKRILDKQLVDYVAMDIKGNREMYEKNCGFKDMEKIQQSMKMLSDSGIEFEFRITICPVIKEKINWMSDEEVKETAKWIAETVNSNKARIFLQKFFARSKEDMMDERLSEENLEYAMHETPKQLLEELQSVVRKYLPDCRIRG